MCEPLSTGGSRARVEADIIEARAMNGIRTINEYGDTASKPTTGRHGFNISTQRIDELDRECLRHVINLSFFGKTCVDLGCGAAAHTLRIALCGWNVFAYDLAVPTEVRECAKLLSLGTRFEPIETDLRYCGQVRFPDSIDCIYSQRFVPYLTYDQAVALLREVRRRADRNCKIFLSASGLGSELSKGYATLDKPIADRHGLLEHNMALKHQILAAITLYTPAELERLARTCGFTPERVWVSDLGNCKFIGVSDGATHDWPRPL